MSDEGSLNVLLAEILEDFQEFFKSSQERCSEAKDSRPR